MDANHKLHGATGSNYITSKHAVQSFHPNVPHKLSHQPRSFRGVGENTVLATAVAKVHIEFNLHIAVHSYCHAAPQLHKHTVQLLQISDRIDPPTGMSQTGCIKINAQLVLEPHWTKANIYVV